MKDQFNVERYSARLEALVKRKGADAIFVRYKRNAYKEITEVIDHKDKIRGFMHTTSTGVTIETSQAQDAGSTVSRRKHEPKFLIIVKAGTIIPVIDDYLFTGHKKYRVTGVEDIGSAGFAFDVSLEVVDNGQRPL